MFLYYIIRMDNFPEKIMNFMFLLGQSSKKSCPYFKMTKMWLLTVNGFNFFSLPSKVTQTNRFNIKSNWLSFFFLFFFDMIRLQCFFFYCINSCENLIWLCEGVFKTNDFLNNFFQNIFLIYYIEEIWKEVIVFWCLRSTESPIEEIKVPQYCI